MGPAARALFEEQAAPLYLECIESGVLPDDDPRLTEGGELRAAFDLLTSIGLLVHDEHAHGYLAVDPSAVASRVVAPMSAQGAELLAESSQWATHFGSLSQAWRRSPGAVRGPFTEVRGEAINPFIASIVADAEQELLTAQPQIGRDSPTVAAATIRDTAALERGVRQRTLYQHSARRSSVTHRYVAAVTQLGAEVRTLDEFFNRLIVIDRRVAVIPSHAGLSAAIVIREASMVAYLVDMFERSWERARPFASRDTSMARAIAAEQRAMTIRMLIEGHADPTSAKRLGVSPRTYAGYVAELKVEFDVATRYQLGYALGLANVSGREREEHE